MLNYSVAELRFFTFSSGSYMLATANRPPEIPLPKRTSVKLNSEITCLPVLINCSLDDTNELAEKRSSVKLSY